MIFFAVVLLSVSSVASFNTWDGQTVSLSDLLRRLNDFEQRLQVQERINGEQEEIIKHLIHENKMLKNLGMPETDISLDTNKQNASEGFNNSFGNRNSTGNKTTAMPVSNSKLKSKIYDRSFIPEMCCQKSLLHFRNDKLKRRSVTGGVAFYSYLTHHESNPGHHQTIVFDSVITNVGGNYNRHTGTFFCPANGVYTFSWTLYCSAGGHIYSEIVVNSNAVGAMRCSGEGANTYRHTTSVVVVEINQGDAVYIRTHPTSSLSGYLPSGSTYRSSFSGWKLF